MHSREVSIEQKETAHAYEARLQAMHGIAIATCKSETLKRAGLAGENETGELGITP